ncbi:tetratricopeptide repeat protein [Alkalihalobacillus deserti]|uniref:tetratricopeptide repeat protein n=1 Tax=Alkalihalobacillus deserti TaxID=2879466 RepID=UPI001D135DEC|nr:hypothetical protein [Alkalihalobacillus deserti]
MNPTEWTLSTNKGIVTIQGQKLTLFQQCKIIECRGSDNHQYLLFFYKDDFLTVQPLVEFDQASFLGQVEKKGCHLATPNPLFSKLLPSSSILKITPLNQLLSKIDKNYSPEETALIFSYFDSYIPAEKLEELLKNFFFTYRRNGKLLAAYRLAMVLLSRGYKQDWIVSTTKHPDYANMSSYYQKPLSNLLANDPIYVEQQYFLDLNTNYNLLMTLYSKQNRSIDSIIIHTSNWLKQQDASSYLDLIQFVSTYFSEDEVLLFLHTLLPYASPKSGLHQDVYKRLVEKNEYETAVNLLFAFSFPLSDAETDQFPVIFEQVPFSSLDLSLEMISDRMFPLLKKQPLMLEKILHTALPEFLKHHSLTDIHLWLQPVQTQKELPTIKKISDMISLMNDPDRQLDLGFHYYDLKQYDKAIDCFNWEMELNPTQIEPIQWLAKSYRKLGKLEEVKTYHSLISQMQRSS